jgi:hypothetical protein
MEEVLGISANDFVAGPKTESLEEVIVLTPPLNSEERELLAKVLASVHLQSLDPIHSESENLPDGTKAEHILSFFGYKNPPRELRDATLWWHLPTLKEMAAANDAETTVRKKEAWAVLQQFKKEKK